ncbi:MAG: transcriptional regulatory protein LiaR [Nitrospinaceae bacterium]|nr:MAG: transcriptional regulatory protein LiaR [Nitrospinaceae bacterium]
MNNKSILLVDDEMIILKTISHVLKKQGYFVNTASDGKEGLRKFTDVPCDLVITDLIMEGVDGIQFSKAIKKINPVTEIVILTGYPSLTSAIDALKLGACDYLLKPCQTQELLNSVDECLQQQKCKTSIERKTSNLNRLMHKAGLTSREIEICHLIKKGLANSEISSQLNISLNTTKNHIKQIHDKLQVSRRAQLVSLLNQ